MADPGRQALSGVKVLDLTRFPPGGQNEAIRRIGAVFRYLTRPTGAHTDEVLAEAGFSPQEVDELRSSGVFGDPK